MSSDDGWLKASWFGKAWAAPVTGLGMLAAWATKSRLVTRDEDGARYYHASGPAHWWMEKVNAAAYTLGACVFCREAWYPASPNAARLMRHELRHYAQWRAWGVFMLVAYPVGMLVGLFRGGWHSGNPFERDAYAHESPTPRLEAS